MRSSALEPAGCGSHGHAGGLRKASRRACAKSPIVLLAAALFVGLSFYGPQLHYTGQLDFTNKASNLELGRRLQLYRLTEPDSAKIFPPLGKGGPFVFVHVPKTAGTTITKWLKDELSAFCTPLDVSDMGAVEAAGAASRAGGDVCYYVHTRSGPGNNMRGKLSEAILKQRVPVRGIFGHVPFGFCTFAERGCTYVTVLREPRERVYSHFRYLQRRHPDMVKSMCGTACTFKDFLHEIATGRLEDGLDNMQTRMISGDAFWHSLSTQPLCGRGIPLHGCDMARPMRVTRDALEAAKFNLEHYFSVIATTEDLNQFRSGMVERFNLSARPLPGARNTASDTPALRFVAEEVFDQETLTLLKETQSLDIELYSFAKQLIQRRRDAGVQSMKR